MESVEGSGGSQQQQQLVGELFRVLELVRELGLHLSAPGSSSGDLCRDLIANIVALTDRSIGIAAAHFPDASTATATATRTPQPLSATSSPLLSDVSNQPFRTNARKRKATARWTSQVRVSATVDDGHSWRKYGQKDILGAKHPRGYYRCTYRNSQSCSATKQVQRTDEDPALFDVVYHSEHTCRPASGSGAGAGRKPPLQHNPHAQSLLQSLSTGLTVDTENSLHATVSPPTPENRSAAHGVSPSMTSPLASDSNGGLSMSPYQMAAYGEWPSDGELQEVVSALTTVHQSAPTPAPAMETEFPPYYFEFDPTFDIDAASLFM